MKYEIRTVIEERGLLQVTTMDERWYTERGPAGSVPQYFPSSTWIAGCYPKGIEYMKWLASKGWNEAEAAKNAGGARGSKAHKGCEMLLDGQEIRYNTKITNRDGYEEELTTEEYRCLMSFADWFKETNVEKVFLVEKSGINPVEGYGGTIDLVCVINGVVWIIDFKTSAYIWKEYELQLSSYKHLLPYILPELGIDYEKVKIGILQLGYTKNRKGFKFTELEDKFALFMHAKAIWAEENSEALPAQKDYPLTLKLNI